MPDDKIPFGIPRNFWRRMVARFGEEGAHETARMVNATLKGWLCWEADNLGGLQPEDFERAMIAHHAAAARDVS